MAANTSQEPADDGQFPLAAQIPLPSFTLPTFPPEASHLRALTLTSDINLEDYQSKHLVPGTFEPSTTLPTSITHLTLELFSLGFPAAFLASLAKSLPKLQSLTLFACLIDGLDDASRKDALRFFETAAETLQELHIVDTYARTGFWKEVGTVFKERSSRSEGGLAILEVSYTYRGHYESDFLNRIYGDEWAQFVSPSVVGLSLNFSAPPAEEDEAVGMIAETKEDQELISAKDGILPFASDGRASNALRKSFEALSAKKDGAGSQLKVLNTSMFALRAAEVGEIAYAVGSVGDSSGLVGFTFSVLLENGWFETFVEGLKHAGCGRALESIEVVGVPVQGGEGQDVAEEDAEKLLVKSEESVKSLASVCPKLESFGVTILRSRRIGSVVWQKQNERWDMTRNKTTTA